MQHVSLVLYWQKKLCRCSHTHKEVKFLLLLNHLKVHLSFFHWPFAILSLAINKLFIHRTNGIVPYTINGIAAYTQNMSFTNTIFLSLSILRITESLEYKKKRNIKNALESKLLYLSWIYFERVSKEKHTLMTLLQVVNNIIHWLCYRIETSDCNWIYDQLTAQQKKKRTSKVPRAVEAVVVDAWTNIVNWSNKCRRLSTTGRTSLIYSEHGKTPNHLILVL